MQEQIQKDVNPSPKTLESSDSTVTEKTTPSWSELDERFENAVSRPTQSRELTKGGVLTVFLWTVLFLILSILTVGLSAFTILLSLVLASISAIFTTSLLLNLNKFSQFYLSLCIGVFIGMYASLIGTILIGLSTGILTLVSTAAPPGVLPMADSIEGGIFLIVSLSSILFGAIGLSGLCYGAARSADSFRSKLPI